MHNNALSETTNWLLFDHIVELDGQNAQAYYGRSQNGNECRTMAWKPKAERHTKKEAYLVWGYLI